MDVFCSKIFHLSLALRVPILESMNAKRMLAALAVLLFIGLTASAVQIVSVDWNAGLGVVEVGLDSFPNWGSWRMLVDGIKVSMEGGNGKPVVRPNGPYPGNPTGLFIVLGVRVLGVYQ